MCGNSAWKEAAAYAEEGLLPALKVLEGLMQDENQASTARSAAAKTFVDVAVRLHDAVEHGEELGSTLDRLLEEFRDSVVAE